MKQVVGLLEAMQQFQSLLRNSPISLCFDLGLLDLASKIEFIVENRT
jgi:hypothetical protein